MTDKETARSSTGRPNRKSVKLNLTEEERLKNREQAKKMSRQMAENLKKSVRNKVLTP